jgi:hypothetical protein
MADSDKPARDPRIVKHMRVLASAAEARDAAQFIEALKGIRNDDQLSPPQLGAILKTIAHEQAAAFREIVSKK